MARAFSDSPWDTEQRRRQALIDGLDTNTPEGFLPNEGGGQMLNPAPTAATPPPVTTNPYSSPTTTAGAGTLPPVTTPAPVAPTAPAPVTATPATPDPFAAMGGGVQLTDGGWVPRDHPLAANAPATTAAAGTTQASGTTAPAPTQGNVDLAVRQNILQMLDPNYQNVDITAPTLQGQAQAYDLATQRNTARQREMLAERMAQEGLNDSGAMQAGVERLSQAAGEGQAGFEANLVGQELAARRRQIEQALATGAGLLTSEQQRQLQLQLAAIQQAMSRYQTDVQNQQFYDTLGFNIADRNKYWEWFPYQFGFGG